MLLPTPDPLRNGGCLTVRYYLFFAFNTNSHMAGLRALVSSGPSRSRSRTCCHLFIASASRLEVVDGDTITLYSNNKYLEFFSFLRLFNNVCLS